MNYELDKHLMNKNEHYDFKQQQKNKIFYSLLSFVKAYGLIHWDLLYIDLCDSCRDTTNTY